MGLSSVFKMIITCPELTVLFVSDGILSFFKCSECLNIAGFQLEGLMLTGKRVTYCPHLRNSR